MRKKTKECLGREASFKASFQTGHTHDIRL